MWLKIHFRTQTDVTQGDVYTEMSLRQKQEFLYATGLSVARTAGNGTR